MKYKSGQEAKVGDVVEGPLDSGHVVKGTITHITEGRAQHNCRVNHGHGLIVPTGTIQHMTLVSTAPGPTTKTA